MIDYIHFFLFGWFSGSVWSAIFLQKIDNSFMSIQASDLKQIANKSYVNSGYICRIWASVYNYTKILFVTKHPKCLSLMVSLQQPLLFWGATQWPRDFFIIVLQCLKYIYPHFWDDLLHTLFFIWLVFRFCMIGHYFAENRQQFHEHSS